MLKTAALSSTKGSGVLSERTMTAVTELSCGLWPSVHWVDAMPFTSVESMNGDTEPPPAVTLKATSALATGTLSTLRTRTLSESVASVEPGMMACGRVQVSVSMNAGPTQTTRSCTG